METITLDDQSIVYSMSASITVAESQKLYQQFNGLLLEPIAAPLKLDCSKVTRCDSAGVQLLLMLQSEVYRLYQQPVYFLNVTSYMRDIMVILGLWDEHFKSSVRSLLSE